MTCRNNKAIGFGIAACLEHANNASMDRTNVAITAGYCWQLNSTCLVSTRGNINLGLLFYTIFSFLLEPSQSCCSSPEGEPFTINVQQAKNQLLFFLLLWPPTCNYSSWPSYKPLCVHDAHACLCAVIRTCQLPKCKAATLYGLLTI